MKNVNELVQAVKVEGMESTAFSELFIIINAETIEPKAESFKKQLKGDVAKAVSEGYELLMKLIYKWEGTGSFHTLYKTSYTNLLKNEVKATSAQKRKHNTSYEVSLSETIPSPYTSATELTMIDALYAESLYTEFDVTEINEDNQVEVLLEQFREKKPEQADLIDIMLNLSDNPAKSELTDAVCNYYGTQKYTGVIQKRVSRAKESFYKFISQNNYTLNLNF